MILLDEHKVKWIVMPHDPAAPLVAQLKKRGFTTIVLTRYNYRTALLDDTLPPQSDDIIHSTRLSDCRKVLDQCVL